MCFEYFREMKRILTFFGGIFLSAMLYSQNFYPPTDISIPSIKKNIDTILVPNNVDSKKYKTSNNRMPNGITNTWPPIYKGNNHQDFDIYESTLDQMPILIPDSTNYRNMLNFKIPRPQEQASNIPKFIIRELEERQKAKDSLYMKKSELGIFAYPKE